MKSKEWQAAVQCVPSSQEVRWIRTGYLRILRLHPQGLWYGFLLHVVIRIGADLELAAAGTVPSDSDDSLGSVFGVVMSTDAELAGCSASDAES